MGQGGGRVGIGWGLCGGCLFNMQQDRVEDR